MMSATGVLLSTELLATGVLATRVLSTWILRATGVLAVVEARRNIAKMLIVVVCMFALCYLPVHLINMLRCVIVVNRDVTSRR